MDRLAQLEALLAKDPRDVFCLYGIAMEHFKNDDLDQAISHFDRAIAVDPDTCYAYYHKARCLDDMGQQTTALETLQAGLARARVVDAHAAAEIEALIDELS